MTADNYHSRLRKRNILWIPDITSTMRRTIFWSFQWENDSGESVTMSIWIWKKIIFGETENTFNHRCRDSVDAGCRHLWQSDKYMGRDFMNWYRMPYFGQTAEKRKYKIMQKLDAGENPLLVYLIMLLRLRWIRWRSYHRQNTVASSGATGREPLILGAAIGMD